MNSCFRDVWGQLSAETRERRYVVAGMLTEISLANENSWGSSATRVSHGEKAENCQDSFHIPGLSSHGHAVKLGLVKTLKWVHGCNDDCGAVDGCLCVVRKLRQTEYFTNLYGKQRSAPPRGGSAGGLQNFTDSKNHRNQTTKARGVKKKKN